MDKTKPENVCPYHSGVVEEIEGMNRFAKLAMVIFVLIAMAIVGFLWHGQTSIWNEVKTNHMETMTAISDSKKDIAVINQKFDDRFSNHNRSGK